MQASSQARSQPAGRGEPKQAGLARFAIPNLIQPNQVSPIHMFHTKRVKLFYNFLRKHTIIIQSPIARILINH